jgi:peptidyl-prolyl cis-trans isomerase D
VTTDISVAKAANLAALPSARRKIDAVHARAVQADCARISRGPITDGELAEFTERHWREVDVGERVTVFHAVALRNKLSEADARAKIAALREELKGTTDVATFQRIAGPRVDASKGALVMQPLPPFTMDGRTTEGEASTFDSGFVRGAFAIGTAEPLSPVIESAFGWHVLLLVARQPAKRLPEAERRAMFGPEAQSKRSRACLDSLLSRLRTEHRPVFSAGSTAEIERIQQAH